MSGKCRRGLLCAALALSSLLGQGCGMSPPTQPADRAEALVERVLDAWSRGEPPDAFGPDKAVQATDPDWKAGWRLLSFLSVESKPAPEAPGHFSCRVALSLRDPNGKKVDKEVVYDVQLGQTSVISRAPR